MALNYSSLVVDRFEPNGPNMIHVRHFTGHLLLGEEEANQLRTLLNEELAHIEFMPVVEAFGLMEEQADLVAQYAPKA